MRGLTEVRYYLAGELTVDDTDVAPHPWDRHGVGHGTDPMELAAVVFDRGHRGEAPIGTGDLRRLFARLPRSTFYDLLSKAEHEGLVWVDRRFAAPNLVHPRRMV